ncbi:FAD-dependent oxidoreductase [Altericroceibacterium endophyticum]|uniref:FAD-dependent oxidoreductase n=1 Tax=Altericroceibacterium endophyticum TaxID=1808508 RepID=A0A6I4T2B6_9SPHN|nr:FAD-dependent oxidoreductase [Altericroceibacterium endophyticum]MXO65028.1 FAD-dependent oxidoreductase [Altericroceibacterium endophyticum]
MTGDQPRRQSVTQTEDRFLASDVFEADSRALPPPNGSGTIREDARNIDIYHRSDVVVIGGGPAGCAAAWAAAQAGADVTLIERYNCLGGLSTGGLVMWIDRMTDWDGNHVIQGFARHFIDRMPKEAVAGPPPKDWGSRDPDKALYWGQRTTAFHGIVTWAPTLDPERMKLNAQEMLLEAGVRLVFHAWAARPVVENGRATGAVFESKAGRQAIMAKVVIDTTGDGDMFARAGAEFDSDVEDGDVHHSMNTGWIFGGVNMDRFIDWRVSNRSEYEAFLARGREEIGFFQAPYVSWRPDIALFLGPRQSGLSALDVDDMTEVEIRSHRFMERHCRFFRDHAPGFEHAFSLQSASQLGVRHTRRLAGVGRIERGDWGRGTPLVDEVGISPSVSPKFPTVSVPYGALVPRALNGMLAAGRHISCDANSHGFMREIPQCWMTGHAAGVGAALAADQGIEPRDVTPEAIRAVLRKQGAHLSEEEKITAPPRHQAAEKV